MSITDNREPAIRIVGLKKRYKIGSFGSRSLREDITSWVAKKRGREDPNAKIGKERLKGKVFMALNGIDLEIKKGETVGIIGVNGAGKSTLLKLLCQITAPTEGEIELFGRITSMLEVGTGFNGEMTGRENIYQNGAILGMSKKEINAVIDDIIAFSEVGEFIDTPVKRYSSGMFVKLGFAVASHLESEIVIMDEVLAVGDIDYQKKCLKKMRTLAKEEHKTVLYVSHNMSTVRELCDRVIVLDEGRVIYDGATEEGISAYIDVKSKVPSFHYDLSKTSTYRKNPDSTDFKMMSIDLCKSDSIIYKTGEKMKFRIGVLARKDYDNVGMLLTVTSAGNPVGSVPCIELGGFCKGEQKEFEIALDTDYLTEGKYDVSLCLFDNNSPGRESFDVAVDAFRFDISQFETLGWRSPWGHVIFEADCRDV